MRQKNGMLVGIFSLVICVIIVMGVMTPIVSDWTTGERIENEGAGWLRMVYDATPSATYEITIDSESNVTNGSDTQSGNSQTIFYADSNLCVWSGLDSFNMMGTTTGSSIVYQSTIHTVSIVRDASGVTVTMDGTDYEFGVPEWAYVPLSTGNFGFFENGIAVDVLDNHPIAAVGGGFAGVYAYNNIFRYAGLGLGMETEYDEDGKLVNVSWDKITEEANTETPEPLGAPYIRIAHEDDIDEIDSVSSSESGGLRAVPTPTYTDGDWGYEIIQVDGVDKAVIVSYSGTGGNIVVPATVGGYDVYRFGKDLPDATTGSDNVFDNANLSADSTITFSDGIVEIGRYACNGANKLTGSLVIPSSVTAIGISAFKSCTGFTSLTIPSSVTAIYSSAFMSCSGFTGSLTIPSSVTILGNSAFNGCGFNGTLTLSSNLTTIEDSVFNMCRNFTGSIIIPPSVTSIKNSAFYYGSGFSETVVIPSSVTAIGAGAFDGVAHIKTVIISSDATPGNAYALRMNATNTVLDLSDTIDYSVDHYGLPTTATYSNSIGDCLGYISFTEIGSDPAITGPIATLLIAVPLLMVVGLTIAAMTMMRGRVQ